MNVSLKRLGRLALTGLLGLAWVLSAAAETKELTIPLKTTKKISVPVGIQEIAVDKEGVIEVKAADDGYSVLVTGVRQGKAELTISRIRAGDLVYRVEVEPELKDLADEIMAMLETVDEIDVKVVGDRIILSGEPMTKSSADRIGEVAAAFGDRVLNLTKFNREFWRESVKRALAEEIAIDTVEVEMDGDRVKVMGSVPSQAELDRVKEIATKRAKDATIVLMVRP